MCNTHTEIQNIDMAVLICKTFLMFGMFLDNLHFLYTCLIIWSVLSLNVQVKPGYLAKKIAQKYMYNHNDNHIVQCLFN